MTDEELDAIFPPGYEVVAPPANYNPVRKQNLFSAPAAAAAAAAGFKMAGATPAEVEEALKQQLGAGYEDVLGEGTGVIPAVSRILEENLKKT
jgi:hypothetical protein